MPADVRAPGWSGRAITPGVVHLYSLVDDEAAHGPLPAVCETLLTPPEAERLARLRVPAVRRELLASRTFVRHVLSRYAPVRPADWRFVLGSHGRPEIVPTPGVPPLRFNLSHTRGMLAMAVALGHDVGVDVEGTTRDVGDARLARRFFAGSEADDVSARDGDDRRERFFAYWTLKEAYIKARGLGLAIPLDQFWFHLEPEPPRIGFDPALGDDPAWWRFERWREGPRHALAVAVRVAPGQALALEREQLESVEQLLRRAGGGAA
jgi:4'-phosphopantetheinyl transferase